MIDALDIGYAIKDRRAELGLTQAQLAEAAGISKRCLWSLELGQNSGVQLDKLTAVLGALGLDLTISSADVVTPGTQPLPLATSDASPDAETATDDADPAIDAFAILTGGKR